MNAPSTLFATLAVGFVLGLRHALDTDHMVAVSTLVARERSVWKSTLLGAIWGMGHTATLFVMGILIIVLGLQIPESVAPWLENAVAAMLIFLGVRTLWQWKSGAGHFCTHPHQGKLTHPHFHIRGQHSCSHETVSPGSTAAKSDTYLDSGPLDGAHRQSFLVGMIHGLSGSAELMLLVLATIRHPAWALTYIVIFGAGMMVAMFALTTLFSLVLGLTSRLPPVRFQRGGWSRIDLGLRGLTGVLSLVFGCHLLWNGAVATVH